MQWMLAELSFETHLKKSHLCLLVGVGSAPFSTTRRNQANYSVSSTQYVSPFWWTVVLWTKGATDGDTPHNVRSFDIDHTKQADAGV